MRSYILPLAAMVAAVLAVPVPGKNCKTEVYQDKVVEIYDVTVTSTVYVTAGAEPTYVAPVVTETYTPPAYTPAPVYNAPVYEPAPEPKPEPAPAPGPTDDVAKSCLNKHNEYRAQHGAPALRWSDELASYAASSNNGNCAMVHTGGPYGENLAKGYSDPAAAIEAWYNEKSEYRGGYTGGVGHFTQLVWKATTELGCHLRKCGDGDLLICEYKVPGNVVGDNNRYFAENVQA